ncbi:MAG: 2OG-Fe(II) oxygenase family protein [Hyphomicrobiaceae bacterium]|nr:2OG-Fe(II) oxygenase family protein [Hyphomicrobiaceae bacterium]
MNFELHHFTDYWRAAPTSGTNLNKRLLQEFEQASLVPLKQSHFFSGRYENIYLDPHLLASLPPLLAALRQTATEILERPLKRTMTAHWFNHMQPGHITGLHTHDDDNELLSAVYYLKVPPHSGDLILHTPPQNTSGQKIIRPKAGEAIFFDPALPHEVTQNNSNETRLSLALNFGAE